MRSWPILHRGQRGSGSAYPWALVYSGLSVPLFGATFSLLIGSLGALLCFGKLVSAL